MQSDRQATDGLVEEPQGFDAADTSFTDEPINEPELRSFGDTDSQLTSAPIERPADELQSTTPDYVADQSAAEPIDQPLMRSFADDDSQVADDLINEPPLSSYNEVGNQFVAEPAGEHQRHSFDSAELNQLARMMPDPAEDELFDDGMPLICLIQISHDLKLVVIVRKPLNVLCYSV